MLSYIWANPVLPQSQASNGNINSFSLQQLSGTNFTGWSFALIFFITNVPFRWTEFSMNWINICISQWIIMLRVSTGTDADILSCSFIHLFYSLVKCLLVIFSCLFRLSAPVIGELCPSWAAIGRCWKCTSKPVEVPVEHLLCHFFLQLLG